MTKEELIELLDETNIDVSEGEQDDIQEKNRFPRLIFFDYVWDFHEASSDVYSTTVSYQISFFSRNPRDSIFISLIKKFIDKKVNMTNIQKEFIENGSYWHYYFSIEILENIL